MNRTVLVAVESHDLAEKLRSAAKHTTEVVQVGERFGFTALFGPERPTKGDPLDLYLNFLEDQGATSSLSLFMRGYGG